MKKTNEFKKGAASFYIVAIATLLLVIIATSFIAVIISEITRTSNNDLAQSAYDSALAGIEDAKLAYYNYQECLKGGSSSDGISCADIRKFVEIEDGEEYDCNMTADILGRQKDAESSEVLIEEANNGSNNMQQAYTCVIFKTNLSDYLVTLNSSNPTKVVRPGSGEGFDANAVKSIKVSWQIPREDTVDETEGDGAKLEGNYIDNHGSGLNESGIFGEESDDLLPPILSVGLIQTAANFDMESFDKTMGDQTNRGTIYLVPSNDKDGILDDGYNMDPDLYSKSYDGKKHGSYINAYDKEKGKNVVKNSLSDGRTNGGFLKSNDKETKNLPYAVKCGDEDNDDGGYMCSVVIDLPGVVGGGARINSTFGIVLSLPYSTVGTDVRVEYFSENSDAMIAGEEEGRVEALEQKGIQVEVDSTGRANDLYRRVVTRLNVANDDGQYPIYAIQLLGTTKTDGESLIDKNISPTCEWNFGDATGPRELCDNT